jgi:SpoVK/Ycf46/Vps4 family AAA+-type ATPase
VAQDAAARARLADRPVSLADLQAAAADRCTHLGLPAATRRQARAAWSDLVLPAPALGELRAAALRLIHRGRAAALLPRGQLPPGQRLLFTGGPGTGKTLAAEVLARETGSALIVADTPRLVSKWLGETERNLAGLFRAAEESQAMLFFDEADAIFGKRIEAQEARDRYANLQTAYLLQRIESFAGLVILATNLPGNLDEAFRRRFDAIIDFPQPDAAGRAALWRRHLPRQVIQHGVNLDVLAEWFALPGGLIRNAAVAAAYLAAADDSAITAAHLHHAIAREYRKNGRPFPGLPDAPVPTAEEELHHG